MDNEKIVRDLRIALWDKKYSTARVLWQMIRELDMIDWQEIVPRFYGGMYKNRPDERSLKAKFIKEISNVPSSDKERIDEMFRRCCQEWPSDE